MAVELFFLFNCHGFKPVAIEKKKSGNEQHDPQGHAQKILIKQVEYKNKARVILEHSSPVVEFFK
jgi:hypothetical protein